MNPQNVTKFDRKKADLKRSVMRLWQENDWSMTDAHFEGLRKKLHEGGYTLADLQRAVTEYTRAGGTHAPRFGDLVTFLKSSKAGRNAGTEKLPEPSEADKAASRAILDKLNVDAMPELSPEERDALLAKLGRKDENGNPAPVELPECLTNLEPASDTPQPGAVKPESDLLAEARGRYQGLIEPEAEGPDFADQGGNAIRDKDSRRVLV